MNFASERIANPFFSDVRRIGVVSPGSVPDAERIEQAVGILESFGIEAVLGRYVFERGKDDFYAACAEKRTADFNSMINDSSIDMIYCARGGCGSSYIIEDIDFDTLRRRNLAVLGYSDITAIHCAMLTHSAGQVVYTKVLTEFPKVFSEPLTRASYYKNISCESQSAPLIPVKPFSGTVTGGRVVTGNLSIMSSLCGTKYMPDLENAVLILEDVGDLPRKIDRMLLQLSMSGAFDKISALIFASYTDCGEPSELDRIFERISNRISVPCFKGFPYGHDDISYSLRGNAECSIACDCTFNF